jgi:hypothetical protein
VVCRSRECFRKGPKTQGKRGGSWLEHRLVKRRDDSLGGSHQAAAFDRFGDGPIREALAADDDGNEAHRVGDWGSG